MREVHPIARRRRLLGYSQEMLAEAIGVDRTTVARWERGTIPHPHQRALIAQHLQVDPEQLAQWLGERVGTTAPTESVPHRQSTEDDLKEVSRFTTSLVRGAVGDSTLEHVDVEVRRLALRYTCTPIWALLSEVRELRTTVFGMIEQNRYPQQIRSLHLAAARLCGLQAHVFLDLGRYRDAEAYAHAAWACAGPAGHPQTQAWVRSVQSLISYWTGDFRGGAALALDGRNYARHNSAAVRLPALQARAAAALGDADSANSALEAADEARDRNHAADDNLGGLLDFPEAKYATYAGTTLLALGGAQYARRAATESTRAIALHEETNTNQRSVPDLLAARLDLATAYLMLGELDGTAEQVKVVGAASPEHHTASIRKRAGKLRERLVVTRYGASPVGRELQSALQAVQSNVPRNRGPATEVEAHDRST